MKIYRFSFHWGRSTLRGIFAVDERGEADLRELIASKAQVYFGEACGKHSEVYGSISEGDVSAVEATDTDVAVVCRVFGAVLPSESAEGYVTITGYNPLAYDLFDDGSEG